MRQRRGPTSPPVFDWSVRIEHVRALIRAIAGLQAAAGTIDIDLLDIGERKPRRPEDVAMRRCRESLVERTARRARNMDPDRVEDASIALVGVKPLIEKLTEKPAGLRVAESVGGATANRKIGAVSERRGRITDCGESNTRNERRGSAISNAIVPARFKRCIELQPGKIVRV